MKYFLMISACQNMIVPVTRFFSFTHLRIHFLSSPSMIFLSLSSFFPREPSLNVLYLIVVEASLVDFSGASSDTLIFSEALSDMMSLI